MLGPWKCADGQVQLWTVDQGLTLKSKEIDEQLSSDSPSMELQYWLDGLDAIDEGNLDYLAMSMT